MNKLNIKEATKIYVACPANSATGGPELLHQLVYELNNIGLKAYMYYYERERENPVHNAYIKYQNPYTQNIEENEKNILIVPEAKTDLIYEYSSIQKVIWWLSVDNFYNPLKSNSMIKHYLKNILYKIGYFNMYRFEKNDNLLHFVQSEYARKHLQEKGIKNIYFLGDYLNEFFLRKQLKNISKPKKNIVIYNPKKGIEFTKKLIKASNDIKFVPIKNMTREEVANILSEAKVYIDFGNHPGKDRIPREAAISGCCIITGKQGSAKYYKDVSIESEFKFQDEDKNIGKIIDKINDCFKNYMDNSKKFDLYREKIQNEQNIFIEDIKKIFL